MGTHRAETAKQPPRDGGRLVDEKQQHDREQEQEPVDHTGQRQPVLLGALEVLSEREQVVVGHGVQVHARQILEDRRGHPVARHFEVTAIEHSMALDHRVLQRLVEAAEQMQDGDRVRVRALPLRRERVLFEHMAEVDQGSITRALHPRLVQGRDPVAPYDLHLLSVLPPEAKQRRRHRERGSPQDLGPLTRARGVLARAIGQHPARAGLFVHLHVGRREAAPVQAVAEPVADPFPCGERRGREVYRDVGGLERADRGIQRSDVLSGPLVDEREVHEDRARLVERERLEHLGVARVGDRERLPQRGEVLLAEQHDKGLPLAGRLVSVLHDRVDDGLRPRREVHRDAVEVEEQRAERGQEDELHEHPE